jgi:hypothetical protein
MRECVALGASMSDDDKICVDAEQPATLNNGAGKLTDFRTLREAVMAWHRLPPEQTKRASLCMRDDKGQALAYVYFEDEYPR